MNIAFIPARRGSKSIKLKNIRLFCGKPLIYWNIKALSDSSNINEIIIATDCDEIKEIVESFGFSKTRIFKRSIENSGDDSSTESVMLEFLDKQSYKDTDNFILVQATSPLTETSDFDQALIKIRKENADSLLTCVRTKRFLWRDDGTPTNYNYRNRPRRQEFDGILVENGAFYINQVSNILCAKNRLSGKISIYEMEGYKYIEIDEEDDWIIAENLMRRNILSGPTNIKVFLSDVDGTLTDAGMYYSELGDELKKFSTKDGKGFELLRERGIKTGIITSELTRIVTERAKKLKIDYLYQGVEHQEKLDVVKEICRTEKIDLTEVAYIGDDLNCIDLLKEVGFAACPSDAVNKVKSIPGIRVLNAKGGHGAVREFIETII